MSLSVQAAPRGRAKRTYTFPAASFDVAADGVPVMIRTTADATLAALARSNGSNLRFLFPDGSAPPQTIGYAGVLETDVAWTLPSEPSAVRFTADGIDRTFVGLFRNQASAFDIGQYDHLTNEWSVTRLANITEVDDHNGVTIAIHPDGTVFAFCPQHGTANLRVFRSDSPADITDFTELSFGTVDVANATYAQPLFIGTTLFVSWRDGEVLSQRPRVYTTSDDKGATWTTRKTLIDEPGERPYSHIQELAGDIHVWFSRGLENEVALGQNHIYHGVLRLSSDSFYASNGTLIGTVDSAPLSSSNATLVMSAATNGNNLRTAGGGFDTAGNPVCGINEVIGLENVYHHARWDGSSWSHEQVVTGGENLYGPFGSLQAGGNTPGWRQLVDGDKALASVQITDRTYEIREYTRSSSGGWSYKVISSSNSGEKIRPLEVVNGHAAMRYLYLSGEYHTYSSTDNRLDLCAYPGPVAKGRLTALVELDFDGVADVELNLVVGSTDLENYERPLSDALVLAVGEIGRRTILDDSTSFTTPTGNAQTLDGLTGLTILGAVVPKSFVTDQYLMSDFGPTSSYRHLLLRLKQTTGHPNIVLRLSDETTHQVITTDIAASTGELSAVGAAYDSSTIRVARNGVLSMDSTPGVLPLRSSSSTPLYAGASPHVDSANQLRGSQDLLVILPTSRSPDWLQMATLGCGPAVYTVGGWEDLPGVLFAGATSVATVVGEVLQN